MPLVRVTQLLALFFGVLATHLSYVEIVDDHFDRISRGQQIARFSAVPFRDFFDPGYFLTIYSSAAAQSAFGSRLLGEALLSGVAIAVGITVTAVLVRRVTRSSLIAGGVVVLLLLAQVRAYDYDKVLFYPLCLYACWRYIDSPTRRSAAVVGAVTAVGGLYRFDTAMYLLATALATFASTAAPSLRALAQRIAMFGVACLLVAAPALLFVQTHGGLAPALGQISSYAVREGERTRIFHRPQFGIHDGPRVTAAALATPRNAEAVTYVTLWTLPAIALMTVIATSRRATTMRRETVSRGIAALVLCVAVNLFILRDPIASRYAALMPPALVLAAWLFGEGSPPASRFWTWPKAAAAIAVGIHAVAIVILSAWIPRAAPLLSGEEGASAARIVAADVQRRWSVLTSEAIATTGLAGYLARCTRPDDRILVEGYLPQVPFRAKRAFAGGVLVMFGNHWARPEHQQLIVNRLAGESVPIVIGDVAEPFADYPVVAAYIERRYRTVGSITLDGSDYTIYVTRDSVRPFFTDAETMLPCFSR